jgi:hypothetical protein
LKSAVPSAVVEQLRGPANRMTTTVTETLLRDLLDLSTKPPLRRQAGAWSVESTCAKATPSRAGAMSAPRLLALKLSAAEELAETA